MSTIIPVKVRTARKRHVCNGFGRRSGCRAIEPGEQYEDIRVPPWRDGNESPLWWKAKVHHPSLNATVNGGPTGCEIAAAYRENAERDARLVVAA